MSVLTPFAGERFLVRNFKYWEGIYDREWVNNYFIIAEDDTTLTALTFAVQLIQEFERVIHDTRVTFARSIASTYLPDSDPYDGNEFVTVPFTGTGERSPGLLGDILPLTTVRFVRFTPASGRSSLLGYRGSFYEGEVNSASGRMEFDDPALQQAFIDTAVDSSIAPIISPASESFRLCSGSVSPRPIVTVTSARPGHLPMKHKYFNTGGA